MPPHLSPAETVLLNAKRKADAVSQTRARSIVIGVDTLVVIDGVILGKPETFEEARRMLKRLSGREHEVFTGVWIQRRSTRHQTGFFEMSRVRFRRLRNSEIDAYIEEVHSLDKAGAYAVQEDSRGVIAALHGSRTNVMGLPMERLREALIRFVGAEVCADVR